MGDYWVRASRDLWKRWLEAHGCGCTGPHDADHHPALFRPKE